MSDAWLKKLSDPSPWVAPAPRPPPIELDGFVVRLYAPGDGPKLFEAINADRAALLPWMAWSTTDHRSIDDSIHYVERVRRAAEKPDCLDFAMGIFDRASGTQLGGTGLHHIRPELRSAEIGYWVRGDRQRSGICTRAIGALISSALRCAADGGWGLRRIVIYNSIDNVGSRRVCERLGLRLEMRMRRERYLDPLGYRDMLGFAVLDDEWDFDAQRTKPNIGWSE
jgi:RimJ/RimL family protein N-acetyltransferase